MSSLFVAPFERRYAQHPRRYLNEYHWDARRKLPAAKGRIATLASAKSHATRAIDVFGVSTVRVFDHLTGKYLLAYRKAASRILIHEGYVK